MGRVGWERKGGGGLAGNEKRGVASEAHVSRKSRSLCIARSRKISRLTHVRPIVSSQCHASGPASTRSPLGKGGPSHGPGPWWPAAPGMSSKSRRSRPFQKEFSARGSGCSTNGNGLHVFAKNCALSPPRRATSRKQLVEALSGRKAAQNSTECAACPSAGSVLRWLHDTHAQREAPPLLRALLRQASRVGRHSQKRVLPVALARHTPRPARAACTSCRPIERAALTCNQGDYQGPQECMRGPSRDHRGCIRGSIERTSVVHREAIKGRWRGSEGRVGRAFSGEPHEEQGEAEQAVQREPRERAGHRAREHVALEARGLRTEVEQRHGEDERDGHVARRVRREHVALRRVRRATEPNDGLTEQEHRHVATSLHQLLPRTRPHRRYSVVSRRTQA